MGRMQGEHAEKRLREHTKGTTKLHRKAWAAIKRYEVIVHLYATLFLVLVLAFLKAHGSLVPVQHFYFKKSF